jgi:hypothetical protein
MADRIVAAVALAVITVLTVGGCGHPPVAARLAEPVALKGQGHSASPQSPPSASQSPPSASPAASPARSPLGSSSPATPASEPAQPAPASQSPAPPPAGLQADGQLETGCAVTRTNGSGGPVTGAGLTLYNPGPSPVYVTYVGVEWNDGQVTSNVPYGNSIAPGQVRRLPVRLTISAIAATSCTAGWS